MAESYLATFPNCILRERFTFPDTIGPHGRVPGAQFDKGDIVTVAFHNDGIDVWALNGRNRTGTISFRQVPNIQMHEATIPKFGIRTLLSPWFLVAGRAAVNAIRGRNTSRADGSLKGIWMKPVDVTHIDVTTVTWGPEGSPIERPLTFNVPARSKIVQNRLGGTIFTINEWAKDTDWSRPPAELADATPFDAADLDAATRPMMSLDPDATREMGPQGPPGRFSHIDTSAGRIVIGDFRGGPPQGPTFGVS